MGKELVQRLQDELDKAALGGAVRRFLQELSRLGVEVDVAPETTCKLVDIDVPVGGVVEGGEGFQREASAILRACKANITLQTNKLHHVIL